MAAPASTISAAAAPGTAFVNLLAPRRREARRQRMRARVWFGVCVACGITLLVVYGAWSAVWAGDTRDLTSEIAKVNVEINDTLAATATISADLANDRAALAIDEGIAGQPDWSLVLLVLGKVRGEEIVLNQATVETPPDVLPPAAVNPKVVAVTPVVSQTRDASFVEPQRNVVRITGYGRSQFAVSNFVLRLEEVGLFDSVALQKNTREAFLNGEAVAFRIECVIRSREGETR